MASTEPDPKVTKDDAPVDAGAEPKGEDIRIPKQELDKVRGKLKAEREEKENLQKELEELRKTQKAAEPDSQPKTGTDEVADIRKELAEIRAIEELRGLAQALNLNQEQAAAVHVLIKEAPGLSPSEALTIASARDTELFKTSDSKGYDPSQHGTLRPGSGPPPKPNERAERLAEIRNAQGHGQKRELRARLLGERLASAMGLDEETK
jgi:hypothetical protein